MTEQVLRIFVSSPGDVPDERRRVDLVVERLNTEFAERVRIETIRWEAAYYSAHDTFQKQIPEAAECDAVLAVFRARLGTELPATFPHLPSGEPYPSGTAYEVLSAIAARKGGKDLPDVFVFRYPNPPTIMLDSADRADIESQWTRLNPANDAFRELAIPELGRGVVYRGVLDGWNGCRLCYAKTSHTKTAPHQAANAMLNHFIFYPTRV